MTLLNKIKAIPAYLGINLAIYRSFWKIVKTSENIKIIYSNSPDLFKRFPLNFRQQEINLSFNEQNLRWTSEANEVIRINGKVFIEPSNGQIIGSLNNFFPFGRIHEYVYPDICNYLLCRLGMKKITSLKTAIHFDGYISENYYHYYINILSAIWLLDECGIDRSSTPFLIGKKTYDTKYFQWLLQHNDIIKQANWVVMKKNCYYKVDELIKPIMHIPHKEHLQKTAALYRPLKINDPDLKVFLYRDPKFGRVIVNMKEIAAIAKRYGFIMMDTGEMAISKQIEYFSSIKCLIAIHGAGITNIIFSNYEKLKFLEILPGKGKLNTHYYWLANTLGVWYDAILSSDMNKKREFYLDPIEFEFHLRNMIAEK
jgi:hypothetical protein